MLKTMPPRILVVFGTRPELIKIVPIIKRIERSGIRHEFLIVNTHQHTGLMKKDLVHWNVQPDITFTKEQEQVSLGRLLASHLNQLQDILEKFPSLKYVLVQGDT